MAQNQQQGVLPWLNKLMTFILRSPLHGLVSSKIMLISFVGRRSGKTYTTPVSYLEDGNLITLFTHADWIANLVENPNVTLRLRGHDMDGKAQTIATEVNRIADVLAEHLRHNRVDARFYNVTYDDHGDPKMDEVRQAAADTTMVQIRVS